MSIQDENSIKSEESSIDSEESSSNSDEALDNSHGISTNFEEKPPSSKNNSEELSGKSKEGSVSHDEEDIIPDRNTAKTTAGKLFGKSNFIQNWLYKTSLRAITSIIIVLFVNIVILDFMFSFHTGFHIINEYEKGVRLRLGKFSTIEQPGLNFAIPIVDKVHILKTWEHVIAIPSQEVVTKDLVTLSLDAVLRYVIRDPRAVVVEIDDADRAGTQVALAAIKEAVGEVSYEKLISERRDINEKVRMAVDRKVRPWGLTIRGVEIKKSVPSSDQVRRALTQRAIAAQEKISKIILTSTEVEIAKMLVSAGKEFGTDENLAKQLRFLQTLEKLGSSGKNNFIIPFPLEGLFKLQNSKKLFEIEEKSETEK